MKGIGYSTILLAFVIVVLVISVGMLGFLNYHVSLDANKELKYGDDLWKSKKLVLLAPTIINLLSIAVLGVLTVTG